MSVRFAELPIHPKLRDLIKKDKRELTYTEYLAEKLGFKKFGSGEFATTHNQKSTKSEPGEHNE